MIDLDPAGFALINDIISNYPEVTWRYNPIAKKLDLYFSDNEQVGKCYQKIKKLQLRIKSLSCRFSSITIEF